MRTALVLATLSLCLIGTQTGASEQTQDNTPPTRYDQQRQAEVIARIESSEGAYSAALTEPLLSLGILLQSEGRHSEALALLKRATHLARINGGLNNPNQIPLLKSTIRSLVAIREYELADERQRYLYHIQSSNLASSHALTVAHMEQAQWQFDAYLLEINQDGHNRLINMAQLYESARDDIIARRGELSAQLLQPLLGILQTQYLIAGYREGAQSPCVSGARSDSSVLHGQHHRFAFHQQRTDVVIRKTIAHLSRIDSPQPNAAQWRAETGIMLGDWLLCSGRQDEAMSVYAGQAAELEAARDAQSEVQVPLDQPVALPALRGLRWLRREAEQSGDDTVQLSFDVTSYGRVRNVQRLDENEAMDGPARQLMRQLRRTTFRPRFAAGMPVETQNVVKNFVIDR